jgi:hypothetical protein
MNTTYRLGKCLATVLTIWLLGFANGADAQEFKIGHFMPKPCAILYLAVPRDMVARVHVHRGPSSSGDRLMIRAFDPEENLSFWEYSEPGGPARMTVPGSGEITGIPLEIPMKPSPGDILLDVDIPLKGNGVNQIRISACDGNCLVEVVIPETVPYGISFQNGNTQVGRVEIVLPANMLKGERTEFSYTI